ncbi:MAG TPA: arylsulfatase [Gemmataceae bacterium]|jgi:arylsulfatase
MKPRCPFLVLAYFAAVLMLAGRGSAADAPAAKRPNVLIVLSDDQGYGDFSCHGNPVLKTPNLDKLHEQSIRLSDFHVAPMCTPTRGQLMTGLDALHSGASSVCAGRSFVRRGIPTMAEIFAANGYRTGHFGKWHLGDSYPNLPHQRGFQETVYFLGWGITSMADLWQNDCFDGRFRHNGVLRQYKGYCTDVWFQLAMDWMKQCQQKHEPFFVYLPTNAAHGPHWVADKYKQPYKGRGPAGFFGMLANLDENMGRLDTFLSETGLRDNTIVIFFNDNGGTAGVNLFNAGMRGRKTQYYEGGHRAACFLRWPVGNLRRPADLDGLTEVQDLLPTLVDLCGLHAPEKAKFDGVSLAPLLTGKTDAPPDRLLVVQYGQRPAKGDAAVLWRKWRLVKNEELYDLKSDPAQKKNVAAEHADILKKMRDHYDKWWAGVAPTIDDFSPISIGSDKENPVCLSAADWANVYCDNMHDLRQGRNRNGPWHLLVEQEGTYEIALRRWPKEADAAISAGVPPFKAVDGGLEAGKALPIVRARLKIGDVDESRPVAAADKEVMFTVKLKGSACPQMQTWFYDADGKELCGAYFAYVRRK